MLDLSLQTVFIRSIFEFFSLSGNYKSKKLLAKIEKVLKFLYLSHNIRSVRIQGYSGPHFPSFGLNTKRYGESLRIEFKCGKMRTRITPNMNTFHAVLFFNLH